MKGTRKVIVPVLLVIILLSSSLFAVTRGVTAASSSKLTIGIVGTPSDPFNPITQIALIDHWIQSVIYGTLVTYNTTGSVVPYMANSYSISPDGLTYTFNLNHNLKWSDGQALTSADVVFTLNATIEYSTRVTSLLPLAEPDASTFSHYTLNTSRVSTPDSYTVVLHITQPNPQLLAFFADFFYVLPEHVEAGQNLTVNTYINSHVVTSGPWYLASASDYQPGSFITLTANPQFFKGMPKIQKLVLQFFQTASAAETALRSGSIEMMNAVPYADASSIKSAGFNIFSAPEMRVFFLQYNMNQNLSSGAYNPISNQTVREALGYATNISALVNSVSNGYFKVWGQAEPYGMTYAGENAWNSSLPDSQFPYDPVRADQLLNQSGYVWSGGSTPRLNITLITLATIPYFVVATQILQSEWAQIGVKLTVNLEQTSAWVQDSFSAPQPKSWNIDLYDLTEPSDPFYPANFLFGPGSGNAGNFTNADIQNLVYNVSATGNAAARAAAFQLVDSLANKHTPYLFLATETEVDAWSSGVAFSDGIGGVFNLPLSIYAMNYVSSGQSPGVSGAAIAAAAVVVVLVVAGVVFVLVRRRSKGKS